MWVCQGKVPSTKLVVRWDGLTVSDTETLSLSNYSLPSLDSLHKDRRRHTRSKGSSNPETKCTEVDSVGSWSDPLTVTRNTPVDSLLK